MPIKDQSIYPPYWKQFSLYIRKERSGGKCEECGLRNYSVGYRKDGGFYYYGGNAHLDNTSHGFEGYAEAKELLDYLKEAYEDGHEDEKYTLIVLTVAHLDAQGDVCRCQDLTGFLCANPAHVKAMCQQCHNRYDRPKRTLSSRATNTAKNDQQRSLFQSVTK